MGCRWGLGEPLGCWGEEGHNLANGEEAACRQGGAANGEKIMGSGWDWGQPVREEAEGSGQD